jgi:hypothetical protein
MKHNEELTNGIQLKSIRVMYDEQLYDYYGVPLGACAFGCKILKPRNVVKITTDIKMNFRTEVH